MKVKQRDLKVIKILIGVKVNLICYLESCKILSYTLRLKYNKKRKLLISYTAVVSVTQGVWG